MSNVALRCAVAAVAAIFLVHMAVAQPSPPPEPTPPGATLSPQQLDDLVAPIALYPDPLLGEVLAASTYPLEIAEAEQWVRDHPKWKPSKLMDEAKKQNWDPSVQGLVAFPDVLARLTQNIDWTTAARQRISRPASRRDAGRAAHARAGPAERHAPVHAAGDRYHAESERADRDQHRAGQPGCMVCAQLQSRLCLGTAGLGCLPAASLPRHRCRFRMVSRASISASISAAGAVGAGAAGAGGPTGTAAVFSSTTLSFIVTASATSAAERRSAVPRGCIIPSTGSACRTAIARWRIVLAAVRFRRRRRLGDSAHRRAANFNRGAAAPQQRFGNSGFEQRAYTDNHSVFGGYHDGGMTRMQSDRGFSSMGAERVSAADSAAEGIRGGGGGGGGARGGGGRR